MTKKNITRTPEEQLKIAKEYRNTPITLRTIAEKYNTEIKVINTWGK